ncbi:MAG: pyridoxal phosphate-dependent aminotransferase family protein [Roseococcus sp.]|nr:pyridoxal phosphate-dependent aminotransferase family protein [Roseococcus sp.]
MDCAQAKLVDRAEEAAFEVIPEQALSGIASDILIQGGQDMLARWDAHQAWWDARRRHGMAPSEPGHGAKIAHQLDLTLRDHLNLATHPTVREAARLAVERHGLRGQDPGLLEQLEQRIARFLGYADCTLFPTGWAARHALVTALARPGDHIVMDEEVNEGLRAGALQSGAQRHVFRHLCDEAALRRLAALRATDPGAGILLMTESRFPLDSEAPDLPGLQALCRQYGATLLVDVSQDLGILGADGRGGLGAQGMLGLADVVIGGFSRSFASQGGFVATHARSLRVGLRQGGSPQAASPPLAAVQLATVLAAFDVMASFEGTARRQRLMRNASLLREGLTAAGFTVLGEPSATVPVLLGPPALARLMTRHAQEAGALVHLAEPPAVSRQACRWTLQVTADHTPAEMRRMVGIASQARERALAHARAMGVRPEPPPQPASE